MLIKRRMGPIARLILLLVFSGKIGTSDMPFVLKAILILLLTFVVIWPMFEKEYWKS
jgi:hypothetical protein